MKIKRIGRFLAFLAALSLLFVGCGGKNGDKKYIEVYKSKGSEKKVKENSLEGVHVFSYGNTQDPLAISYYEGFRRVMEESGERSAFMGTLEISPSAQMDFLEDLIDRKPSTITICGLGYEEYEGYEKVFLKAQEAGIPIFSVNGLVPAPYRVTHFDGVGLKNFGTSLIQLAYLISQKAEYNPQLPLESQVAAVATAKSKPKAQTKAKAKSKTMTTSPVNIACLTDATDATLESVIMYMQTQLQEGPYANKVNSDLSLYHYNPNTDSLQEKAKEILDANVYDVVIGLTAETTKALAEYRSQNPDLSAKITGLVDSRELDSYMGEAGADVYDCICPYLIYDKKEDVGAIMANAVLQYKKGTYSAGVESKIIVPAYDLYTERSIPTMDYFDGGTIVDRKECLILARPDAKGGSKND